MKIEVSAEDVRKAFPTLIRMSEDRALWAALYQVGDCVMECIMDDIAKYFEDFRIRTDSYDNSLEIDLPPSCDLSDLPEGLTETVLSMGFYMYWVNHFDGREWHVYARNKPPSFQVLPQCRFPYSGRRQLYSGAPPGAVARQS